MRARQTGERLDPPALKPKNFADSCAVMDAVDKLVGERIVGTRSPPNRRRSGVAPLPTGACSKPGRVCRCATPANIWNARSSFRLRDLQRLRRYSDGRCSMRWRLPAFELVDSPAT
jgi:hypothetical protein